MGTLKSLLVAALVKCAILALVEANRLATPPRQIAQNRAALLRQAQISRQRHV